MVKNFRTKDNLELIRDSGGITTTDTQVTVSETYRVGEGQLLEMGSELVLVTDFDDINRVADIERGMFGTTAASHAENSLIVVSPRVYRSDVLGLINACLNELYPDLYVIDSGSLTYDGAVIGYELDSSVGGILRVRAQRSATAKDWAPVGDWSFDPESDTTDFASGKSLMIRHALDRASKVRYTYIKPFSTVSVEGDDLEATAGLQSYMVELPYLYAMTKLMVLEEVERSQIIAAENHQRSQDVPGFLALRTGEWYKARFDDLVKACRRRLLKEHGNPGMPGYGS